MGQRSWITRRPRRLRRPKRRQRFGSDDPRRDSGEKAFTEEWAQRLVFPRLNVARGPIVQQAESGDVARRVRDGDRCAQLVAGADPNAELELVVETAAWPEAWVRFGRPFALAVRAAQRGAGHGDRGGAPVIADWHVFVVGQQRIVGAEQLARVGGVMDAGEEVGVVADRGRKLEAAIVGAMNDARPQRFDLGALAAIGIENVAETAAERDASLAAEREQRIERRATSGLGGARRYPIEQAEFERRGEIEDIVPDRDAAAGDAARRGEHAER